MIQRKNEHNIKHSDCDLIEEKINKNAPLASFEKERVIFWAIDLDLRASRES